jgi:hypothetical protein
VPEEKHKSEVLSIILQHWRIRVLNELSKWIVLLRHEKMSPRLYEDAALESALNSSGFADETSELQEFAQNNIKNLPAICVYTMLKSLSLLLQD